MHLGGRSHLVQLFPQCDMNERHGRCTQSSANPELDKPDTQVGSNKVDHAVGWNRSHAEHDHIGYQVGFPLDVRFPAVDPYFPAVSDKQEGCHRNTDQVRHGCTTCDRLDPSQHTSSKVEHKIG